MTDVVLGLEQDRIGALREAGAEWCGLARGTGARTSLEGSRPAASGTNANENWADLSEGESRP